MERSTIAAVIVLYNPDNDSIVRNIGSCLSQVHHTFLVDNSEKPDKAVINRLKDLHEASYIWNNGNQGIAHALNVGAKRASDLNYQWLLTLDQDTLLPSDFVKKMSAQIDVLSGQQVGLVAPSYLNGRTIAIEGVAGTAQVGPKPVLFTMTSGNILNLKSHNEVGGFMRELFIDHVDHEYCLRLNANGYGVYEIPEIVLDHKPGKEVRVQAGAKTFKYASHNPLRLYYFCRNGFKVSELYARQFPQFRKFFKNQLFKVIAKTLLFESSKIDRIKMIRRAYRDFKRNKFGAFMNKDS